MNALPNESSLHHPTERVLDILELIASAESGLTLTEIATGTGASKSTIFPVIKTLAARKFIFFDKKAMTYSPGTSCCLLAAAFGNTNAKLKMIKSEMHTVVQTCSEVCQMGVLEGSQVLVIARIEPKQTINIVSHIGKRFPATCTGLGKSLLSECTEDELNVLYPSGLLSLTPYSVQDRKILREQLDAVKAKGYAISQRESYEETGCCSVPLRHKEKIIAAISVTTPIFRLKQEKERLIVQALIDAKHRIERILAVYDEVSFT